MPTPTISEASCAEASSRAASSVVADVSKRSGLASTFLTRLKLGPDLVDAAAVPRLYDGAVRPRHLVGALVAGVLALAAAVSVTPVGQQWVDELSPSVTSTTSDLIDNVRGILP